MIVIHFTKDVMTGDIIPSSWYHVVDNLGKKISNVPGYTMVFKNKDIPKGFFTNDQNYKLDIDRLIKR